LYSSLIQGIIKALDLNIIPSLSQDLYLEIDFRSRFGLLPSAIQISESASDSHELSDEQNSLLEKVVPKFPSFAVSGLGKTTLISHSIDIGDGKPVKQRRFPVSPAIEKLLYAEIELG